jgi:Sulfotransferase family
MPKKKDPRFFCFWGQPNKLRFPVRSLEDYEALFEGVAGETAIGESTALYFFSKIAAGRIRETIPEARLIVSLREPVQRAFSIYHMNLRTEGQNEGLSFLEALKVDPILQQTYHSALAAYLEHFDRSRIKVILFEELSKDTMQTVQSLFGFLGVDPAFEPDLKISNPGGVPRSKWFHRLMTNDHLRTWSRSYLPRSWVYAAKDLRSLNLDKSKMQMTEEERALGYAFFRDDILRTQDLVDLDLSRWLRPEDAKAA